MKKYTKILMILFGIFICLTFNDVKALDYSKTYEQAFPDKEFRRLVLVCIEYNLCDYNTNTYLAGNWGLHYLTKYAGSGTSIDTDGGNINIDENLIESRKSQILDKTELDRITYLLKSKDRNPSDIKSLQGIEYLTNLKQIALEKIGAKEVDLSQNKKLVHIALTSKFFNYHENYKSSPVGELEVATLEKVNVTGLNQLEGLMLTLNKNNKNSIDLTSLPQIKEVVINDSNLTEIVFNPASVINKLELNMNSLNKIVIPNGTVLEYVNMFSQHFDIKIKIPSEQEIPFKYSLTLPTTVEHNGNIHKFYINPNTNQVTTDNNGTYEFQALNLGSNMFKFEKVQSSDTTNYSAILNIIVEKDNNLVPIPNPNNNSNINKNPNTGIKTFGVAIILIVGISYLIYKYHIKKKNYVK